MTALRLFVVGVAVAIAGLAQDFSVAVDASHRGDAMDERRVREIVREELAKILSRLPEPNNDPHPEPESDPKASESAPVIPAEKDSSLVGPAVPAPSTLTPAETDANLIERARRVALAYTDNLPNFVCTQTNRSFMSGDGYDWRQTKEAATEVQFVDRRESYRNVTVNGRPSKKRFRKIANFGEFGAALYALFRPEAGAVFTRSGDDVIGGRDVAVFRVVKRRYGYNLRAGRKRIIVGFSGLVSIDKATGHVLRYDAREMLGIPSNFPYQQVSHMVDYAYVPIGGKPHLLPVRSRWAYRYPRKIERDDVEWTSCRKFGAESTVDFE